jgi:putative flippase GtrA
MKFTFVRFLIVGVANTLVGLSMMYLFLHLGGLSYWMSTFLGNSIGACVSYFLNRRFTFKSDQSISRSLTRFVATILFCYYISYNIGDHFIQWLLQNNPTFTSRVKTDIAVLASTLLYTILNYLCQKLFVFPKKRIF